MFSEKTRTIVLFTLGLSDQPLSIDDIAFRTGFGYNTVKRVVFGDPLIKKIDGRPAKFHAQVPKADTEGLFVVEYEQPEQGWEPWLEEIRPLLPSIVALPDEMSRQERERKVGMFKSLGASFLSLAKDMEKESE
jgi:hypothetical protein